MLSNFFYALILQLIISSELIVANSDNEVDYCNPDICPNQGKHVRCNNDGEFSDDCEGELKMVDMTDDLIELILKEHNVRRNKIAGGNLTGFGSATRMNILRWDWSLAKTAAYNVKSCKFGHDSCRATPKYYYAGQNLYYAKSTKLDKPIEYYLTDAIDLWYEECWDADEALLKKYHKTKPQTGHFTMMVNDRHTHVGCACLDNLKIEDERKKRMILFACNYPSTNIRDYPCLKFGPAASDCRKHDENYQFLCDDGDTIDPNNFNWYNEN